jgi:hypothetical protein
VRQTPAGKNVSTEAEDSIENRHQATTGEETAGSEDVVCPTMIYEVK